MGAVRKQAVQRAERGAAGRLDARLPHAPPHAHPYVRLPSHPLPPTSGPTGLSAHPLPCCSIVRPAARDMRASRAAAALLALAAAAALAGRAAAAEDSCAQRTGDDWCTECELDPKYPDSDPKAKCTRCLEEAPLYPDPEMTDSSQWVSGGRARPPSAVARPPHAPQCTHPPDRHRTPATHPPIHPPTQPSTPPGSATRRTCRRGHALRARRAPWTL